MRIDQIGLQLYTLRSATAEDMLGTLAQVADMGYRAVEFAGYQGVPAADLRATLDEHGITAFGAHVPFNDFQTRLPEAVAELQQLGCDYAVVPSVPEARRGSPEQVAELAARFNEWAAACRAEGLRFAYHNHAFEFADGGWLWDQLTTQTDPELVELELDLFWALYAGVDPVGLIQRHAGRAPLLHVKDMADDDERSDTPVGTGTIAWEPILAAGDAAGARWFIVEQDHPRQPLEDVRTSLRNLERLAGG